MASVAVAIAAGGYAVASAGDPSATSARDRAGRALTRETPYQGVVARLPYVGTLTWRCDSEQRFSTALVLPSPGASVLVSLTSDGVPVWRGRQVNPSTAPEHARAEPPPARSTQTWTIRYNHMPATLKVVARLRFAAPRPGVECLVSPATIETKRTPH